MAAREHHPNHSTPRREDTHGRRGGAKIITLCASRAHRSVLENRHPPGVRSRRQARLALRCAR
eukprot:5530012-Pyramimonas_sp.AAC.1